MVVILIIAVVAVLVLVFVGLRLNSMKRSKGLKANFGTEYDRAVRQTDSRGEGEKELTERQKRVESMELRELGSEEQRSYIEEWRLVQARFVDDPATSISDADALVTRLMTAVGYPMADFETRAADVSVGHAEVVPNYRAAHAMAERHSQKSLDTEELRQAMVHYRAVFDDLLGAKASSTA